MISMPWANCQRRDDGRLIGREYLAALSRLYNPEAFTDDIRAIYRQ
jgi:hypothetical protein